MPGSNSSGSLNTVTELYEEEELWDWTTFLIEGTILPVLAVFGIAGVTFQILISFKILAAFNNCIYI